jgi:hypothetical protein
MAATRQLKEGLLACLSGPKAKTSKGAISFSPPIGINCKDQLNSIDMYSSRLMLTQQIRKRKKKRKFEFDTHIFYFMQHLILSIAADDCIYVKLIRGDGIQQKPVPTM